MDKLTDELTAIRDLVGSNTDRLDTLQGSSKGPKPVEAHNDSANSGDGGSSSGGDDGGSSGSESNNRSKKAKRKTKRKKKAKVGEDKQSRVDEEKQRQLKLLLEKLKAKEKSGEETKDSSDTSDSSFNLKVLKKKLTKKEKKKCDEKVAARLKQAGALFPEDSFSSGSSSDSSGTDSEAGRRHRKRKVKSGAKIKKRPVVRTELWPHTIANEEDVEEVTSETIGLSKFLSCFSYIMLSCGKVEATGRAALLHAISSVLECLPWVEARAFHNLVMLKLEQGKFDWRTNFTVLANQFLDKRVRQSLRSKGTSAGASGAASKFSGKKSFGKGSGNPRFRQDGYSSGKGKSLNTFICRQWNQGACSYGDRCKLWHVCWSCAEAGKLGELPKASSNDCTSKGKSRV